ncbi:MAG: accessory factor UbiK family protein [Alphaproteobacteria bacterium]
MQSQNRILDDMARVAGGAMGLFSGLRTEIEAAVRHQLQRLLGDMQLVSREEFEAVKAMAAKARTEQEAMEKRLAAIEAAGGAGTPGATPSRGPESRD